MRIPASHWLARLASNPSLVSILTREVSCISYSAIHRTSRATGVRLISTTSAGDEENTNLTFPSTLRYYLSEGRNVHRKINTH